MKFVEEYRTELWYLLRNIDRAWIRIADATAYHLTGKSLIKLVKRYSKK